MSLLYGTQAGDSVNLAGMSQGIYVVMDGLLSPPLQQAVDDASDDAKPAAQEALTQAREGWKKLSYAIAKGVVDHLRSNMEIRNIQTQGNVNVSVSGDTDNTPGHFHTVNLSGIQNNLTFNQVAGTGEVD